MTYPNTNSIRYMDEISFVKVYKKKKKYNLKQKK